MASLEIELKNVAMSFGSEKLFSNVNLQITKGEIFVLIGPSGQGKSVLLKIMAGILPPTEGQVFVEGHNLYEMPESERHFIMKKMGMLFQKNALFDSINVSENIAFPLREVYHQTEKEIAVRVNFFLERVGIAESKDLFPDEISGGMQKRLGIARALALNPEIILYDDPTAGLDPITSRMIIDLILELQKENNSTVVSITNDMNRAYQMAHRIGMIVDGEFIVTGDVDSTKKHEDQRVHQFIHGLLEGPLTEELYDSI